MIQVHPTHFEQIIMNLALNARDAAGPDGTLTIATDRSVISEQIQCSEGELAPQPYVVVTVTDDGIGMDESTLARIFEPFFTTKHADEGCGIGLATVYGLMTQNEGVIDVQSVPGHGTTFRLYFPEFQTAGARGPS